MEHSEEMLPLSYAAEESKARNVRRLHRPIALALMLMAAVALWLSGSDGKVSVRQRATHALTQLAASDMSKETLFCFAVTMTTGNEIKLIREQFAKKVGIFACDSWAVYSAESTWLESEKNGPQTTAIPGPPSKFRPMWGQMRNCNVDYLLRAWKRVTADPRLEHNNWVVKVDPDAVFFPMRLRPRLLAHQQPNAKIFIKNCKKLNSMQGPIEVLSRDAAKALVDNIASCKAKIVYWNKIGEDQYMTECLGRGDAVAAQGVEDFGIMRDGYCDAPWPVPCANSGDVVALHPFKKLADWNKCYAESKAA